MVILTQVNGYSKINLTPGTTVVNVATTKVLALHDKTAFKIGETVFTKYQA